MLLDRYTNECTGRPMMNEWMNERESRITSHVPMVLNVARVCHPVLDSIVARMGPMAPACRPSLLRGRRKTTD
jgi:hypothetical protein